MPHVAEIMWVPVNGTRSEDDATAPACAVDPGALTNIAALARMPTQIIRVAACTSPTTRFGSRVPGRCQTPADGALDASSDSHV
jgi:hypothetical protein